MFNARDMYTETLASKTQILERTRDNVGVEISRAARRGEFFLVVKPLDEIIINELVELGYMVDYSNDQVCISWDDPRDEDTTDLRALFT